MSMSSRETAFTIFLCHWLVDSRSIKRLYYMRRFNAYMNENCTRRDILSLSFETTLSGIMEVLHFMSVHLLEPYRLGSCTYQHYKTHDAHAQNTNILRRSKSV